MTTRTVSSILLLLLGLVGLGVAPASASTSTASTASTVKITCQPETDAVVTVDASTIEGEYTSLCAQDVAGDQLVDLVEAIGLPIQVTGDAAAKVCRIDGHPTPTQADCEADPSAAGTWVFFTAEIGGEWSPAQEDTTAFEAAAGEFVTFQFVRPGQTPTPPDERTTRGLFTQTAAPPSDASDGPTATPDVAEETVEPSSDAAQEAGAPTAWLIVGLMVAVVVIVGGAVVVLRRRDRNG